MSPTLTVLIATIGQRRDLLARLLNGLMPQADAQAGRVKVIAFWDNGETDIASKRQALIDAADTDYVCFVDDDDTVTDDYVSSILEALETRPDFVGLWMMVHKDGEPHRRAELSLKHDGWFDGPDYYCRDITHENPMRTSILREVDFRDKAPGDPEDTPWAAKLRGRVKTEVMVDRVLYHYWWVPSQSTWGSQRSRIRSVDARRQPWQPLRIQSPYFTWHPDSTIPRGLPMADMLIIVPARSRPQNIERLIGAWGDSGAWGAADLRIDIDADDPAHDAYMAISLPPGVRFNVWPEWRPTMHKVNDAARAEADSYFALGFMGDDHVPRTHGWAQHWLDVLHDMDTGIVYGDDGYQHANCPTQWAMTSDIVRAIGRMVPSPVEHLWSDTAVLDLGVAADCIRYLPETVIEHMHYIVGKAPRDEQYERVNSRHRWDEDETAYRAWQRDQLPADAAAVRALKEVANA